MIVKYVGPEIMKYIGASMEDFLEAGNKYSMFLQPLTDVHLDPSIEQMLKPANDPKYLYIFGGIAILIILIASINFMNLSTAQASKRAKEISIKKVSGSTRGMLINQFLTETIILSFFSLILALLIVEISLPYINDLLGLQLWVGYFSKWYVIPMMIGLIILIGVVAGSYPAFYLSSFNPYVVLKGGKQGGRGNKFIRSILVVLQFSTSIILIVGTIIMYRQISYMQNKELGWDKEHVLVIRRASVIGDKIDSFKEEIKTIPGVINISASTAIPGHSNNNNGYMMKGRDEESFLLQTTWADYDFLETYGIKVNLGRFFDRSFSTDSAACVVNETAAKLYMNENPLEARFLNFRDETGEMNEMPVIGVINDYHYESLQKKIGPSMIRFKTDVHNWGYISVKLSGANIKQTINQVEETWSSFTNGVPMQYTFIDKDFARLYKEEKQNATLSILFTILGILIATLGLYGLTAFTVAQRTKEIGVRKAFGASVGDIWYLISKEIITLIVISALISWPLVYWVAINWLDNYEYRISPGIPEFLASFIIAVLIALATISYRVLKAARANPTLSLKYE
jgi:putative ABC transport system permease protein